MKAIAGIADGERRKDVEAMLEAMHHRARGAPLIREDAGCTLGIIHSGEGNRHGNDAEDGLSTQAYLLNGRLILQRDPLGVEPLYFGYDADGELGFASEAKALLRWTRDVYELQPGTIFDGQDTKNYFSLEPQLPFTDSVESMIRELRGRLNAAVERRVSRDTMGAWLSGGLDSSAITAFARMQVGTLHTFAAGMAGAPDLEAARMVADFLKTQHHQVIVSAEDLLRLIPTVIYHLESFDALLVRSSLMHYLAGQAAADHVSEVFSGEGGDELFAGYAYLKQLPLAELAGELIDITGRLHNTALQRVDRCAAAFGLTPHICFLDPSVVEFALSIPVEFKLRGGVEKWILRQSVGDLLPESILKRPKAKFWEGAGVGEILATHAEHQITDKDFASERILPNGWKLATKEELMYYRAFREHFGELERLDWMGRTKGAPQRDADKQSGNR